MNKTISKIVIYYSDGTYQEVSNNYAFNPTQPYTWNGTGCKVCGVGKDGTAMGYVCTRADCPTKATFSIPKWGYHEASHPHNGGYGGYTVKPTSIDGNSAQSK